MIHQQIKQMIFLCRDMPADEMRRWAQYVDRNDPTEHIPFKSDSVVMRRWLEDHIFRYQRVDEFAKRFAVSGTVPVSFKIDSIAQKIWFQSQFGSCEFTFQQMESHPRKATANVLVYSLFHP